MLQHIGKLIALSLYSVATLAGSVELRLDEERMFLRADHESLLGVLSDFVRMGVEVRIEPGIDAIVTGTLEDSPIEVGLDTLLESFNYVLYWERLPGPAGNLTRLSGIHVFHPGRQDLVVPFVPNGENLVVVRKPGIPPHTKDEILLGVKPGTTTKQFRELLASIGATVISSLPSFGVYQIGLPRDTDVPSLVRSLLGNPWVAVAEPNYVQQVPQPVHSPETGRGVGSNAAIRTPTTRPPAAAGSTAVAVFDSGMTNLDQFNALVVGTYDSLQPGRAMSDPLGHGTQMALVASGAILPGGAEVAMASDVTPVLAIRSFDDNGQASNFSLLRGIDYTISQGGRVISMSWGTETHSEFLQHAIHYAHENGMIVVASAGNEPHGRPVYPAAYDRVLGISAMLPDGSIWLKSNHGSFVFAAAPGTGEFPIGYNGPPGTYVGTSIASPYVARALSQYLDQHPNATVDKAISALRSSLSDGGKVGRDAQYGHGALDDAAIRRFLQR